ncbi:bile acid:sodium symporter family protein [Bacteroidota bacterium]
MFKSLSVLDNLTLNFSPGGLLFMNITLAFVMFGIALNLKPGDFKRIIQNPKSPLSGIISQFILLPALTLLLILILNPTPAVAFGMILVAACPGGNISNFMSSLAKVNIALSISLTAFATISAIVLTPLNFAFWGGLYIKSSPLLVPITIDAFEMLKTILILLGIPIIAGIIFASKFPIITKKILKPFKIFSICAFLLFIVFAFSANFDYFIKYIPLIFIIVLLHNLLALGTGYGFSSLMKLPAIDRRTISIETGIQNSGLALILIFNPKIFPPELHLGGMAFIAAWWGIWHLISGLLLSFYWSKKPLIYK